MPIDYKAALALKETGRQTTYSDTQTLLYALSVGMGRDPYDERELPFVFEGAGLRAVPTMAAVLGRNTIVRDLNLDLALMLHGEQRMTLHRPLPPEATIVSDARVVEVLDKGPGKGALAYIETILNRWSPSARPCSPAATAASAGRRGQRRRSIRSRTGRPTTATSPRPASTRRCSTG